MKRHAWSGEPQERALRDMVSRRQGLLVDGITPRKAFNIATCVGQYLLRREILGGWPVFLRIDVSPLCNLRCPTCVHGDPRGDPSLESQSFHSGQVMRPEELERIVAEVAGKSVAASLHYLGDPFMHADIVELCSIARAGRLNVHLCTSFSFALTDERLRSFVKSGATHLTVCVDGLTQETYGLTRAGGRIDWVLSNLERVCAFRREAGQIYPRIEVQYIMFQHNRGELDAAWQRFEEMGVDEATSFWGFLHNFTECDPGTYEVYGPKPTRRLPWCYWPYFSMLIKYNGDVIPCCNHRVGQQYSGSADPRVLGNVFETSVRRVWNSMAYRDVRRLVLSPSAVQSDCRLERSFCHECPRLFGTSLNDNLRSAQHYTFEELYAVGPDGVTTRNRTTRAREPRLPH